MAHNMFAIKGNICGERVRLARAVHTPPISQAELAAKLKSLGFEAFSQSTIYQIERKGRHVIDAELRALAQALGVTMDWLVGNAQVQDIFKTL